MLQLCHLIGHIPFLVFETSIRDAENGNDQDYTTQEDHHHWDNHCWDNYICIWVTSGRRVVEELIREWKVQIETNNNLRKEKLCESSSECVQIGHLQSPWHCPFLSLGLLEPHTTSKCEQIYILLSSLAIMHACT